MPKDIHFNFRLTITHFIDKRLGELEEDEEKKRKRERGANIPWKYTYIYINKDYMSKSTQVLLVGK